MNWLPEATAHSRTMSSSGSRKKGLHKKWTSCKCATEAKYRRNARAFSAVELGGMCSGRVKTACHSVYSATDIANSKSWCGSKDNKWKLAPSLDLDAATKTDVSKTTRKDKPLKWLCQYNL